MAFGRKHILAEQRMLHANGAVRDPFQGRFFRVVDPGPRISEPKLGQHMDRSRLRSAINRGDLHEDVLRIRFRILDKEVEIAILAKNTGIDQFKLRLLVASATVLLNKLRIREFLLRIFIESFQIRMCWRRVEVVVNLFHVFAMVPLTIRETEQSFFQNWILPIPERRRQADALVIITEAADAVFPPAISATAGMIMRKIVPRRSIGTVILTHGSPLALTQ